MHKKIFRLFRQLCECRPFDGSAATPENADAFS
jgi:hypothetical protein